MTVSEFIMKALRVPFKDKGRSYEAWDCYGLMYCFFRDVHGIDLPGYLNYSSTKEYEQLKSLIDEARPAWDEVNNPEIGDVALFNISGYPCHIGILVGKNKVIHTEERLGTFIEPLRGVIWGKRLSGIYRLSQID